MASFASCRRAGWVRFLVVLLCALFLFATLGAPAARAEALTVGLFTAAAVLSAATAALGFKLANSADGQATLAKMVQDFKVSATAVGLVLVGSKINGLIDGVDYIKMQVKAGKTYLDERVVAWVQQWLQIHGADVDGTDDTITSLSLLGRYSSLNLANAPKWYPISFRVLEKYLHSEIVSIVGERPYIDYADTIADFPDTTGFVLVQHITYNQHYYAMIIFHNAEIVQWGKSGSNYIKMNYDYSDTYIISSSMYVKTSWQRNKPSSLPETFYLEGNYMYSSIGAEVLAGEKNTTGLSGSDTIGDDYKDKTLEQTLAGLKEWAPDWWDAGADSSTNSAAGAKDLPLNMGSDVKTVTGNPALEVDQPLIYTPWFEETLDNLRNGETAGIVTNTATSAADTAEKAEVAQGTVEDAQDVVQSIISWGLDYISPDKGLFSRFPLCIPYDAYLLVTAALGVDARDLGEIVSQSPGELSALVDDGVDEQSDFVPVISVKHDWTQDGVTTPVEVTIDLRPYDAIIKMIRTLVSVYVIAELIASEYKRIRGA